MQETTGQSDYFKFETSLNACGVVIDKSSGYGYVQVSGGVNATTKIATGQMKKNEEKYVYVEILNEQTCMLYGQPTVLYVRPQRST